MKTLILTPSIVLGLGIAGTPIAETTVENAIVTTAPAEVVTHKKVSLSETRDFYLGDFLSANDTRLGGLTQDDLYKSLGASEQPCCRFVT